MEDWIRRQLYERQLPVGKCPVMFQRWSGLLFLHWQFAPETVQLTLPPGLEVDTFNGKAWIGIVPFFMRNVRAAGFPAVIGLSSFMELNLRTYVRDESGRPGVWFYSLDANQWAAVRIARSFFFLPYSFARMSAKVRQGEVDYYARRYGSNSSLRYFYRPCEGVGEAELGSLEFFLIERYRLFALRRRTILSGRVYHAPYRLRKVVVMEANPGLFAVNGFRTPSEGPVHAIYSEGVDVNVYAVEGVG